MKELIITSIKKATGVDVIHLEIPEISEHGDYSTNVAMVIYGNKDKILRSAYSSSEATENKQDETLRQGQDDKTESDIISILSNVKSPHELAGKIVEQLKSDESLMMLVDKIEVAGPGFINFYLSRSVFANCINKIHKDTYKYGNSEINKGKKFMVEFAHPNTHKAFHIGHLRNITTGESIVRLLEVTGYEVVRANYQGDVGLHIAKALWGLMQSSEKEPESVDKRANFLGKVYAQGAAAYEEEEAAKKEINEINKNIYSGEDEKINSVYEKTRKWSLDYFADIYKRVYSHFDRLYFESECYEKGKKYAKEALEMGIFEKSSGAVIFPASKFGLHDRVFITSEGVPTYEAKDLGLVKLQMKEYQPEKIIHVVGPEQAEYFKVVFKAQELLFPETKGRQVHVVYGWVRLKEGKMSSRTGKVVLGQELIEEAKKKIQKNYGSSEKVSEQIAVGAVKYSFLKVGREQEIAFDIDESISLEGNSGPYLQYTYARTQSVLKKSQVTKSKIQTNFKSQSTNYQNNEEELSLMRTFIHFPEVVQSAAENYAPNLLCNYLYDLAQRYNTFYNKHGILEDRTKDKELTELRLAITSATGHVLKNGLNILGIKAPERM